MSDACCTTCGPAPEPTKTEHRVRYTLLALGAASLAGALAAQWFGYDMAAAILSLSATVLAGSLIA